MVKIISIKELGLEDASDLVHYLNISATIKLIKTEPIDATFNKTDQSNSSNLYDKVKLIGDEADIDKLLKAIVGGVE